MKVQVMCVNRHRNTEEVESVKSELRCCFLCGSSVSISKIFPEPKPEI